MSVTIVIRGGDGRGGRGAGEDPLPRKDAEGTGNYPRRGEQDAAAVGTGACNGAGEHHESMERYLKTTLPFTLVFCRTFLRALALS